MVRRIKSKPVHEPAPKRNRGQPTKFQPSFVELAFEIFSGGSTNEQAAQSFGVHVDTIHQWAKVHADFSDARTRGKDHFDTNRVEVALAQRAIGYSHRAVKIMVVNGVVHRETYIEHYPPDATALIFWLKNRNPRRWRDKLDHEHSGTLTLEQLVAGAKKPEDAK